MRKQVKMAIIALGFLAVGTVNAQLKTGEIAKKEDKGKSSELNGTIRVIDNKGTKKYLQVENGLTLLTNQTPNGGIVSTWQLGGALTQDTFINAEGKVFAITGTKVETGNAATAYDGAGYTIVVRDEQTGELKKMLATDLLQVQSGHDVFTATAGQTAYTLTTDLSYVAADFKNVSVYRNGAKLVANVDYTIAGTDLTLAPSTTAPNDWEVYAGDVIEVHYIK